MNITLNAGVGRKLGSIRFFPDFEVACGAFDTARTLDASQRQIPIDGIGTDAANEFVVSVRGDSMSGAPTSLVHGDLARLRWVEGQTLQSLVGKAVLVELTTNGEKQAALKILDSSEDGYVLRSTAPGYEDIAGTHEMRVIGEFIERIDPSRYDPAASLLGTQARREDIPGYFGVEFNPGNWNSGHVTATESDIVIFVTLTKEANRIEEAYLDQFEDRSTFHWTSQSSGSPDGKKGRELLDSLSSGTRVHLFVRNKRSDRGFIYAGLVTPLRHEGAKPMVVWFRMLTALTDETVSALQIHW